MVRFDPVEVEKLRLFELEPLALICDEMSRLRLASRVFGSGILSCAIVGWWYRPIADSTSDSDGPKRSKYMSENVLTDFADKSPPLLYDLARKATVFVTVNVFRAFLVYGGDFRIKMDNHYERFLGKVLSREKGESLITVSNHRSLVDDTTLFSSILPYWLNIQPRYLRYSLCAQEYCYYEKVLNLSLLLDNVNDCFVCVSFQVYSMLTLVWARLFPYGEVAASIRDCYWTMLI